MALFQKKRNNEQVETVPAEKINLYPVVHVADSLKELTEKHPIEKITIKEITDKAGVIRPTFYNHFQDKYELIEWIINHELLEPIRPLIDAGMVFEAIVLMLTNVSANVTFYKKALRMEGPVTFNDIAMKAVYELFLGILNEKSSGKKPKYKWLTPEVVSTYYAQSLCFITEGWISQGVGEIEPREMAEAFMYLISRSMEDVLKEL